MLLGEGVLAVATHGHSLVGRGAELDALASGRPTVVLPAAEPGIGKRLLLAEPDARADARRMPVLAASASEFELDRQFWPFWLVVDALDEYLRAAGPDRLDGLYADIGADDRDAAALHAESRGNPFERDDRRER